MKFSLKMVYNRNKIRREHHRQVVLNESWHWIYASMQEFLKDYEDKTPLNQRKYLYGWCEKTLNRLKRLNQGFSLTTAEKGVRLLMRRTVLNSDNPFYNAQQLYIQASRKI